MNNKCPKCGQFYKLVVYGFPSDETMQRAKNGEFKLGGCIPGGPSRYCSSCKEYSDDGCQELNFAGNKKKVSTIKYYSKKIFIFLIILILLPPYFIYDSIKRLLKKN